LRLATEAFENTHVSALITSSPKASDTLVVSARLKGVGAGYDDNVGPKSPGSCYTSSDPGNVSIDIDDLLPLKMSAALLHNLVFDVEPRHSCEMVLLERSINDHWPTIASIHVCNHRRTVRFEVCNHFSVCLHIVEMSDAQICHAQALEKGK
jgi:hypothetical protein